MAAAATQSSGAATRNTLLAGISGAPSGRSCHAFTGVTNGFQGQHFNRGAGAPSTTPTAGASHGAATCSASHAHARAAADIAAGTDTQSVAIHSTDIATAAAASGTPGAAAAHSRLAVACDAPAKRSVHPERGGATPQQTATTTAAAREPLTAAHRSRVQVDRIRLAMLGSLDAARWSSPSAVSASAAIASELLLSRPWGADPLLPEPHSLGLFARMPLGNSDLEELLRVSQRLGRHGASEPQHREVLEECRRGLRARLPASTLGLIATEAVDLLYVQLVEATERGDDAAFVESLARQLPTLYGLMERASVQGVTGGRVGTWAARRAGKERS